MDDGAGPVITSSDDRAKTWLIVAGGAAATIAALIALVTSWPEDEPRRPGELAATTTAPALPTTAGAGTGEPSQQPSTTEGAPTADLFGGGFPGALADLRAAAGDPTEAIEVSVYPGYAFLAYRDPAAPGNLDRRQWRDGAVGDAQPNPIDDRVDPETEPELFALAELDPSVLEVVVADAPSHYEVPVEVTHVIIDRFLPFDERVLLRVYATPADGRSGGGYVSYDTTGALVGVCC